ncbi:hypothetical protein IT408_01000 [Candidatus Uhrbacteria bacterium]|nr:hypothetical protein [Candidatus Uhrbacteria bacterium]
MQNNIAKRCIIFFCLIFVICSYFKIPIKSARAASATPEPNLQDYTGITPKLNIQIPGLEFATKVENPNAKLEVPFLAQYIAAIYKFIVGISVIAAAIMIAYGGFLYIIKGTMQSVSDGKTYIVDACIGLILVFGAYTLLNLITPRLITTKTIPIKSIKPEEFNFMEFGPGFSTPLAGALESQMEGINGWAGTSFPPNPQDIAAAGGINISDVQEVGNIPSQRIRAYCTSLADRKLLDTYEKKIAALAKTILGFHKICVKEGGCAYVRTGFTDLQSGVVSSGIQDYPFIYSFWSQKLSGSTKASANQECLSRWQGLQTKYGAYGGIYNKKAVKEKFPEDNIDQAYADFDHLGLCNNDLNTIYNDVYVKKLTEKGYIGGDCGSTISQIYSCAGGDVGRPAPPKLGGTASVFNYINNYKYTSNAQGGLGYGKSPGKDFPVWYAKDMEDLIKQYTAAGGPRFGDIFIIGAGGSQHNFLYTGGIPGIPFEVFEMGGGGNLDGVVGPQVSINLPGGGSFTQGGMRTHPPGSIFKYVESYGKPPYNPKRRDPNTSEEAYNKYYASIKGKAWPVTVARPYDFVSCKSKNDCKENEWCTCSYKDRERENGKYVAADCNIKNICHESIGIEKMKQKSMICFDDEMCPKGWSCPVNPDKPKAQKRCVEDKKSE